MKDNGRKQILEEYRITSEKAFDNLLVYLASGGLVLSIGFIQGIVDLKEANHAWAIKLTWIAFAIALLFTLISHKSSSYSMYYELKGRGKLSDTLDWFTDCLGWISFGVFIAGLGLFIFFIFTNI